MTIIAKYLGIFEIVEVLPNNKCENETLKLVLCFIKKTILGIFLSQNNEVAQICMFIDQKTPFHFRKFQIFYAVDSKCTQVCK